MDVIKRKDALPVNYSRASIQKDRGTIKNNIIQDT